jgi:MFS family permease
VRVFYGWRVVAACFVIAAFAWALGLFGSSVYLQAVTQAYGWPVAEVASAITLFFLVSAAIQRVVGRSIDRWGPQPILLLGTACMCGGVALIGQVTVTWQLYPCFVLLGMGWSTLSMTGITTTVAPWFERHQGRSMTLAIMGASVGAIAGVPLLLLAVGRLGLSRGLIVVGIVAAIVLAPLIWRVLRFRGPGEIGLQRDGDQPAVADRGHALPTPPIATSANRRVLLWSATAAFALGLTVQIGFITHHVTLAEPLLGMAGAGLLVSATGVTAFVGRLILARIVDRVRVRLLGGLVMVAQTSALLAIALWPTVPVLIGASLVYGYGIGHVTTVTGRASPSLQP